MPTPMARRVPSPASMTSTAVRRDFPAFRLLRAHKEFMHAPPLPVHGLPGAHVMGWHLWIELEVRED